MKIIAVFLSIFVLSNIFAQDIDFEKLNESYYNLNDYDFNGFSADVQFDLLDQLKKSIKDEKYLSILENISIELKFYSKDSLKILMPTIEQTENQQFNQGLAQTLNGIENTVKGFMQTWSELTLVPTFEPEKHQYNINKVSDKIEIQYEQEGSEVTTFLNDLSTIDSVYILNPSANIKIYPVYEETNLGKKIIKTIVTSINDFIEVEMDITYKDFKNIKIPFEINVLQTMQGNIQKSNFILNNIKLL